jgi:NAD(P)-dependent dehydrogenase (short-subunit alcohol dehydrogenase family)
MSFADLVGKVAIVTGAANGIGKAAALGLAREGVKVAVVDWNESQGQAVAAEINRDGQAIFVQADVSKAADARKIIEETVKAFAKIDILHNNAGIQSYGTVVDTDEESWDRTLNVNLKSIFLVSKYAIPYMIEAGGGSIINTASVQAQVCLPNSAAYVASKGAVLALTREMALDFAPQNIRVNAILPGSINTPMLQFAASQEPDPNKAMSDWSKNYPLGRIGTPDEVGAVVVFLASSAAGFITGTPILVDGGLAARAF